jgi:hypothetical protein
LGTVVSDSSGVQAARLDPALSRYHLLVLLPIVGLPVVIRARARAESEEHKAELTAAIRCQWGGAAVWILHLGLQLSIVAVGWLVQVSPSAGPGLHSAASTILWLGTLLNVVMWIIEWGIVAVAGVRAGRGHPYPLSRSERKRLDQERRADAGAEAKGWRPLNG